MRSYFLRIFYLAATSLFLLLDGSAHAQAQASSAPSFRIQNQWNLAGPGGWGPLLFDSSSNRLYIPRTDRVAVLDPATGKVIGEIPGFGDARNVALDDRGKYGYVSDIMDGTVGYVRVFDRTTLKLISSIVVGKIPGSVLFDSTTKTVFSFNSRDQSASVIDSSTNTVVATIALPGKPHLAETDGKGSIFVSFRGSGQIARIDTASRTVTASWPIDPCVDFTGLTIDLAHRQLLGDCVGGKLISVDADSGRVALLSDGVLDPSDIADLAFDPQRGLLFSGSNSGLLNVFHQEAPGHFTPQQQLPTQPRAGTIALDPNTGRVYLVTAKFGQRPVTGKGMDEMQSRLWPIAGSFVVLVAGPDAAGSKTGK